MVENYVYLRFWDECIIEFEDEEDLAKFLKTNAYVDMDTMGWETDFDSPKSFNEEKLEEMARALDNRGNLIYEMRIDGDNGYTTYQLDLGAVELSKKFPYSGYLLINEYSEYCDFGKNPNCNCKFSAPVRIYDYLENKNYIRDNLICSDGRGYFESYNCVLEHYAEKAKKILNTEYEVEFKYEVDLFEFERRISSAVDETDWEDVGYTSEQYISDCVTNGALWLEGKEKEAEELGYADVDEMMSDKYDVSLYPVRIGITEKVNGKFENWKEYDIANWSDKEIEELVSAETHGKYKLNQKEAKGYCL